MKAAEADVWMSAANLFPRRARPFEAKDQAAGSILNTLI
jgi:hypothetical protein